MELAHLITGQLVLISTLLSIFTFSDDPRLGKIINSVKTISWVRVGDLKGFILAFIAINVFMIFLLDWMHSQATISKKKIFSKTIKRSKNIMLQNTAIIFITLISAYIFNSITARVCNFLTMTLFFTYINIIGILSKIKILETWGYFGSAICIILVTLHTFVNTMDRQYTLLLNILHLKR